MQFSLVIPCYNEAMNLPLLLNRCAIFAQHPGCEVVLVNNGSSDNSEEILNRLLPAYPFCRYVQVEVNQGYGFGILAGLKAAKGTIIGWTHADMQTDPQDVLLSLKLFEQFGPGIFVKGKRFGRPIGDIFFTICMSVFETLLLRKPMWDINAQPTMFTRSFFETWISPPNDFSLDLFAYYTAVKQGLKVHRFPVLFGKRAHGISHWNINWAAKRKFIRRTFNFSLELRKSIQNETNSTSA